MVCIIGIAMLLAATAIVIALTAGYARELSGGGLLIGFLLVISMLSAMLGAAFASTLKPMPASVAPYGGTCIQDASGEAPRSDSVEENEPETAAEPIETVAELEPEAEPEPVADPYPSGLTRESGVNWYGGRKETYYSSNVLYHYRTPEWTPDVNGVYRDANGYVVVAASDVPEGSMLDTSFGMGIVYDCGCDYGTTDIYVNW